MNHGIWTIVITISIAVIFLILNPAPNLANAYSCSTSGSVNAGSSSTIVSGNSGSCSASSASTSSKNAGVGGGFNVQAPNSKESFYPNDAFHFGHGTSASYGAGGGQSSCLATSADQNVAGNVIGTSNQGGCSAHSPP